MSLITTNLLRRPGPPRPLEGVGRVAVYDERLLEVVDPDAPLLCLYDQTTHAEGVVWDVRRDRLVWSDVVGRRVLGWYGDGRVEAIVDATQFANGNAVDRDGTLVHCEHGRRCISRSDHDGVAVPFITHYRDKRFNSPNDIVCASDGALWFSDPTYGLRIARQGWLAERELDHQSVYRYDPDTREVERMADFEQPNGLAFSPDGRTLYVSDTSQGSIGDKHEIAAFDVAPGGALSNRRLFRRIDPGLPDGFTVDGRGWIWTTSGNGVQVFDAEATPLGLIPTPNVCANCAFGGRDGQRLFIAAETFLLALDLRRGSPIAGGNAA